MADTKDVLPIYSYLIKNTTRRAETTTNTKVKTKEWKKRAGDFIEHYIGCIVNLMLSARHSMQKGNVAEGDGEREGASTKRTQKNHHHKYSNLMTKWKKKTAKESVSAWFIISLPPPPSLASFSHFLACLPESQPVGVTQSVVMKCRHTFTYICSTCIFAASIYLRCVHNVTERYTHRSIRCTIVRACIPTAHQSAAQYTRP